MAGNARAGLVVSGRSSGTRTDDPIELAAAEIRQVARVATLEMTLNVGEIVFRHLYQSDVELFHKNGQKDVSLRQLAERTELGMSRATLWRAVSTYELSLRVPQLRKAQHLGVSHVRAVLGLPTRDQERLLAKAEREKLDVASVERAAASARSSRSGGGRPAKLDFMKAVDALMRVAGLPPSWFADRRAAAKMKADDVECALAMLDDLETRIGNLRDVLEDRKGSR